MFRALIVFLVMTAATLTTWPKALLSLDNVLPRNQESKPGSPPANDWPQWRGPNRTNISPEAGLLKDWPNDGPPLLWKTEDLGHGVASVAVAGGRVFTLGTKGESEFVCAFNVKDGKPLWSAKIDPKAVMGGSNILMRWLSQRTPTVDGELLYAVTNSCAVHCLETATGKERWHIDLIKTFDAKRPVFGFCDYPLVDGEKLICAPGAANAGLVALDKKSGKVLWQTPIEKGVEAAYWPTVVAEIGGVRQYLGVVGRSLVSVAAKDGAMLWRFDELWAKGSTATSGVVIVRDNLVFFVNGYQHSGAGLLKLVKDKDEFKVEEVWINKKTTLAFWRGSPVLVGDHVYFYSNSNELTCLDFATGNTVWATKVETLASPSMTYADGHLYLHSTSGKVSLVAVTPQRATLKSSFEAYVANAPAGVAPVIVDGRLYIRYESSLACYNIADPNTIRGPNPIFVPTPQDVVEEMLKLAKVTKGDIVYDLGCGDGRIVVTAAKTFGCKAVGIDIDAECVKMALDNVKDNNVEHLVSIKHQDFRQTDFSGATVVTLYLLPSVNVQLIPRFEKLKPGARIVSHAFDMKGVQPEQVLKIKSAEDEFERPLYLWKTPLKMDNSRGS